MRDELDRHIKRTGHENVYFPLFVPEVAAREGGRARRGLRPAGRLGHACRRRGARPSGWPSGPTSEALIAEVVKDWIQSYRDLPLLINLWNNVVRWELRTRLFLRTTEFLWQEGTHLPRHGAGGADEVASASRPTARLGGLAGHPGRSRAARRENEKFPGAVYSDSIEALMRDGRRSRRAPATTSARTSPRPRGIQFLDRDNERKHPYGTSWGFYDAHGRGRDHGPRRRLGPGPATRTWRRTSW